MSVDQSNKPSADSTGQPAAPVSRDPFAKLAKWYDVLHASKNYDCDARLYAKHLGAKPGDSVIEWGCGTGEFTRRFAGFGWKMIGVDASKEMLAVAEKKEVPEWAHKPQLFYGSLNTAGIRHEDSRVPAAKYACAPFAVISYAAFCNAELVESFRRIRRHLLLGGRFVFDVIHAAAAAIELRADETKIGKSAEFLVREHRRKTFQPLDCNVIIKARTEVSRQGNNDLFNDAGLVEEFESTHIMRAFSPPELHLALEQAGFRVLDIFAPWSEARSDEGTAIQVGDYYLMVVAEAV